MSDQPPGRPLWKTGFSFWGLTLSTLTCRPFIIAPSISQLFILIFKGSFEFAKFKIVVIIDLEKGFFHGKRLHNKRISFTLNS